MTSTGPRMQNHLHFTPDNHARILISQFLKDRCSSDVQPTMSNTEAKLQDYSMTVPLKYQSRPNIKVQLRQLYMTHTFPYVSQKHDFSNIPAISWLLHMSTLVVTLLQVLQFRQ